MNILICDDMSDNAEELLYLLHNSGLKINAKVFHNGIDALDYLHKGAVADLCFLDIIMPGMTGIDLAKELRKDGYAGEIIFLSASREYAPESYEVKAFSYLLKPPDQERVNAVLNELLDIQKKRDTNRILIKTSGISKSVPFCNISYVEVIQHNVYFRLASGGEIVAYTTFGEVIAELLLDPRFVRCHRSYIINMEYIAEISKDEIIMRDGARIVISRNYSEVRKKYYKWAFGDLKGEQS